MQFTFCQCEINLWVFIKQNKIIFMKLHLIKYILRIFIWFAFLIQDKKNSKFLFMLQFTDHLSNGKGF